MNAQQSAAANAEAEGVRGITKRRTRMAFLLTAAVLVLYLGFMLLIAFAKPLLSIQVTDGLTIALIFAALIIVSAWLLSWFYVRWANKNHDSAIITHQRMHRR